MKPISIVIFIAIVIFIGLGTCAFALSKVNTIKSEGMVVSIEEIASGIGIPWGMDFIDNETMVVSDRGGRLFLVKIHSGIKRKINGLPAVFANGQGGLLDLALHPNFSKNRLIYFTYAAKIEGGSTTRLARGQLGPKHIANVEVLFTAEPAGSRTVHYGSRIIFDRKGFIYMTVGERGNRENAQTLSNHLGKVIRLKDDGSIPPSNPFVNKKNARPEIWSWGHRNPQGLAVHPKTGELWLQEHGPQGGDEINIIKKGKNYGWPKITYGREYWGPKIGKEKMTGFEQPVYHFTPSIAPSGLMIYYGKSFPKWNGSVFSGAMKMTHINRLYSNSKGQYFEDRILDGWGKRIRNIKLGNDGNVYFSTDEGKIYRMRRENS